MTVRLPASIRACLFDLDGVLTQTAELHAAAWKDAFDAVLREYAARHGRPMQPFDLHADYEAFVDGKPRDEGVRSFLASRGIELPEGEPDDPRSTATVRGVSRWKNDVVHALMAERGVATYRGSVRFVQATRASGRALAIVTSSENARSVLRAAGLDGAFEVEVDGTVARRLSLPGKPAPDVFHEAARRLHVAPARAAVFEDAVAGVAAGRAGGFGLVVGVDRTGHAAALREAGADLVVQDLAELLGAP